MTLRSDPEPKARGGGREELPKPEARAGVAGRSNPRSRHRRTYRSYSTMKIRNGGGKEIPLVQGKEQWLCLAGAAVKKNPLPKVRETQIRW